MAILTTLGLGLALGLCAAAAVPAGSCSSDIDVVDTFLLQTRLDVPDPPSAVDPAEQLGDAIDKMSGMVTDTLTGQIQDVAGTVDATLADTASQLGDTVADLRKNLATELVTTVTSIASSVHELTEQTHKGLTSLRADLAQQEASITQSVTEAGEAFETLLSTMVEALDATVGSMVRAMQELATQLVSALGGFSQDMLAGFKTFDGLVTATVDDVGTAAGNFSAALHQARDHMVAMARDGTQATGAAVQVAQESLDAALSTGDDLTRAVQEQLSHALAMLPGQAGSFLEGKVAHSQLLLAQRQAASALREFRADVHDIVAALRAAASRR